ncbi:hypothetical protein ABKN59_009077 [Abortiporus biennis]
MGDSGGKSKCGGIVIIIRRVGINAIQQDRPLQYVCLGPYIYVAVSSTWRNSIAHGFKAFCNNSLSNPQLQTYENAVKFSKDQGLWLTLRVTIGRC